MALEKALQITELVLTTAIMPLAWAGVYDAAKAGGPITAAKILNRYSIIGIIALAILIGTKIWASQLQRPSDSEDLIFLARSYYEKDVDQSQPPLTQQDKTILLGRFDHLAYAWKKSDFRETISALTALRNGQDSIGPLPKVKSVVVLNNLGCAHFKNQRNKKFLASQAFHDAKKLVGSNSHLLTVVEDNLNALNEMTNAQD